MEVPAMTAVIYARYSSDNQREESIEGQTFLFMKSSSGMRNPVSRICSMQFRPVS